MQTIRFEIYSEECTSVWHREAIQTPGSDASTERCSGFVRLAPKESNGPCVPCVCECHAKGLPYTRTDVFVKPNPTPTPTRSWG